MKKLYFDWTVSHSNTIDGPETDEIPATVPGAVQLDYAKAMNYKPYYYGLNFKQFDWMEDEYFIYRTTLDFRCSSYECAVLYFEGIDYRYRIEIDGKVYAESEGAFTPVSIDVTQFSGRKVPLRVTVFPIPKLFPSPRNRSQAAACCKPASSYGWDWHPRLVPSGIWAEAFVRVFPLGSPSDLEVSYILSEKYDKVTVTATVKVYGVGMFTASLISPDGETAAALSREVGEHETETFVLETANPSLWYPRGYGQQPLYTVRISGNDTVERRIGFRRSRLVRNKGSEKFEANFPKGPMPSPMCLEINGKRVFAKGSNWVNAEIFPCLVTDKRYDSLIDLAVSANMNIFRLWGGQYINREHFYERCDELGIMVWQEFMLSCNRHPDSDHYLSVLEKEAESIVKRLRTHPCIAFWCGGNELFNSWSGLTEQSHALRLLNSVCYRLDRYTPFNMTSPVYGVTHGSYVKVTFPDDQRRNGIYTNGEEFIKAVKRTESTAFTEFGCNAASPKEYILKYIMDENNYLDCNDKNEIWTSHHAFKAWNESCWLGVGEVVYFFGGYDSVDDLVEKSIFLQNLCYKSMFEEMRRKAPLCMMAINWDFNEPWPCAAGNSLVNWPAEPKPCLDSVRQALRPTLLSLSTEQNRYLTGEKLKGTVWVLNDSEKEIPPLDVSVYLITGDSKKLISQFRTPVSPAGENSVSGTFESEIEKDIPERFSVQLVCDSCPEYNSEYCFVHNLKETYLPRKKSAASFKEDFSDFLR